MDQHSGVRAGFWPAGKIGEICPVDPVSPPQDREVPAEEAMEDEEESAEVRIAVRPKGPTKQERDEHNCTHIPYRAWCPICVGARGVASPHLREERVDESRRRPVIAMDYFFMSTADNPITKMLILKDDKSGKGMATIVPVKGTAAEWVIIRAVKFIDQLGYNEITLKSDTEPAIVAVRNEIRSKCKAEANDEDAALGDHQSNGMIENFGKNVRAMVRTLRLHIETSIKDKIADDSPIIAWIVEHAANLMNNCKRGKDGRTPQERLHGKRIPQTLVPLGEKVMFQSLRQDKRTNKAEPRYEFGIWAGIKCGSNEVYILTPSGVARARNIRRLSDEECWDKELLNEVRGTPWDHTDGQLDEPITADPDIPPIIVPEDDTEQVRRMKLTKQDFRTYGYTPNCPGCRALQLGKQSQPHTEACRKRMEEK